MSVEELPVSVYFMSHPETFEDEMIEDFPGHYSETDPDGRCFFDTSIDAVRSHFIRACHNLAPLLTTRQISSMAVGIDLLGFLSGNASYIYSRSDSTIGRYNFSVSRGLLHTYLQSYWNRDITLTPNDLLIWEHEIIHMLDHNNVTDKKSLRSSGLMRFWTELFLSYRHEGIAELYMFTGGHCEIRSMEEAHVRFRNDLKRFTELSEDMCINIFQLEDHISASAHYYSLGPWLVMHSMSLSPDNKIRSFSEKILWQVSNGDNVNHEDTLTLIRYATGMNTDHFMGCLTKPGKKGMVFLEIPEIRELNAIIRNNNKTKRC